MTLDQIYLLCKDKDSLRNRITGTPQELAAKGLIKLPPGQGKSYIQRLREKKAAEQEQQLRKSKRERRKQRREQVKQYKQQQGMMIDGN